MQDESQKLRFTITRDNNSITLTEDNIQQMYAEIQRIRNQPASDAAHNRTRDSMINDFHKLYYGPHSFPKQPWDNQEWMGVKILQYPGDMASLQEIIYETRPDTIVETGTFSGGSAFFMAQILFLAGLPESRVITIDIKKPDNPPNYRNMITYLQESSVSAACMDFVKNQIKGRVMVLLDSDHKKAHVLKEMELYGPLVSPGCYMIVQDSNINGHPVLPGFGPGPFEAIHEYLLAHTDFEIDKYREKHLMTFLPDGYLKKR